MFGIFKKLLCSKHSSDVPFQVEKSLPAKSLVNELLKRIAIAKETSLRVRRSEALPTFPDYNGKPRTAEFTEVTLWDILKYFLCSKHSSDMPFKLEKCPPALSFTNHLLRQIAFSKTPSFRVRRSEALPTFPGFKGKPLTAEYSEIANIMKVRSNLNPVSYRQPVDGSFTIFIPDSNRTLMYFTVSTHFEDHAPDPFFEVTINKTTPRP
jgi:hypothetical protein